VFSKIILFASVDYPPAKTFGEPAATLVHPVRASPTRPQPKLLTNTEPLPTAIGAACAGQGLPGSK
jgi:hypothetical protein